MGTKHSTIYPPPLTLPPATPDDEGKIPVINLQRFGDNGDGRDGDIVLNTSEILNKYAGLSRNNYNDYPNGSKLLVVDSGSDPADFAPGDEILIVQMQTFRCSNQAGDLGKYEFATIDNITDSNITLVDPLVNTYLSDDGGAGEDHTKTQIVKVRQYNSILLDGGQITAAGWDGRKGGIIVIKCIGDITGTGTISATAKGYRAQSYNGGNGLYGPGESYVGKSPRVTSPNRGAGSKMAGGAHKEDGLTTGSSGLPGLAYGTDDSLTITLGSPGGGNYNTVGGFGGGAIVLYCGGQVEVDLSARGQNGGRYLASTTWYGFAGGGGGKILLYGNTINSVTVTGGGGYSAYGAAAGGAGYYRNDPIPEPAVSVKYGTPSGEGGEVSEGLQIIDAQVNGGLV